MPFDVLINGGGIAGPCLAFGLSRLGHAVTITEQAGQLRSGGQAVDFRGPSIEVLDKMGLLEAVRANATQIWPAARRSPQRRAGDPSVRLEGTGGLGRRGNRAW